MESIQFPTNIRAMALSRDEQTLVVADQYGTLHRVDMATKAVSTLYKAVWDTINCIALAPCMTHVVYAYNKMMMLVALDGSGSSNAVDDQAVIYALHYSPRGDILVSHSYYSCTLWEAPSLTRLRVFSQGWRIRSLAFNPSGTRLAMGHRYVEIVDLDCVHAPCKQLNNIKGKNAIMALHYMNDTHLAVSNHVHTKIWKPDTRFVTCIFDWSSRSARNLASSSQGKLLYAVYDRTIKIYVPRYIKGRKLKITPICQYDLDSFSTSLDLLAGTWYLHVKNNEIVFKNLRCAMNAHYEMQALLMASLARNSACAAHTFLLKDGARDLSRLIFSFL